MRCVCVKVMRGQKAICHYMIDKHSDAQTAQDTILKLVAPHGEHAVFFFAHQAGCQPTIGLKEVCKRSKAALADKNGVDDLAAYFGQAFVEGEGASTAEIRLTHKIISSVARATTPATAAAAPPQAVAGNSGSKGKSKLAVSARRTACLTT